LVKKRPSVVEEVAYRDTWGKGIDSYVSMIYSRLKVIHSLLANDGAIYVHVDYRTNAVVHMLLDEIFGQENFVNEIIWGYTGPSPVKSHFPRKHDCLLYYAKNINSFTFNYKDILVPYDEATLKRRSYGESEFSKIKMSGKDISEYDAGKMPPDWWTDIPSGGQISRLEMVGYPTQKPEKLLSRIIKASSNPGDLVAGDFNNGPQWDVPGHPNNFVGINEALNSLGLYSAYHQLHTEEFGMETQATYFHQRNSNKPFHIDYIYSNLKPIKSVEVGSFSEWSNLSDHVPVTVEFE
jgi:adenine specific DNA methylase Mod